MAQSAWQVTIKSNAQQIAKDVETLQKQLTTLKKEKFDIDLGVDEKEINNVVNGLNKMLDTLSQSANNADGFTKVTNQISTMVSEIKAMDTSLANTGANGLSGLSQTIKNIDSNLATLSKHLTGVGTAMNNLGGTGGNSGGKSGNNLGGNLGKTTSEVVSDLERLKQACQNKYNIKVDSSGLVTLTNVIDSAQVDGSKLVATYKSVSDALNAVSSGASGVATKSSATFNGISEYQTQLNQLKAMQGKINSSDKFLRNWSNKGYSGTTFKAQLSQYQTYLSEYSALRGKMESTNNAGELFNDSDVSRANTLLQDMKKLETVITTMQNKGYTDAQKASLDSMIAEIDTFSAMTKTTKEQWQSLKESFSLAGTDLNINDATNQVEEFKAQLISSGQAGTSFFDKIKDKAIYGMAQKIGQMFSIYDIFNVLKQASSIVTEVDSAFTSLAKVSGESLSTLESNLSDYSSVAKDMGATITDVIDATTAWSKNGYNLSDSQELAEVSVLYKNVGDDITIDDANESLISTLKGYNLEASEAESIIDKFNEVSNNFAIDSGGIGEALQRSAASFNAANTDLSESIALITATK